MDCQSCGNDAIVNISAKCSDCFGLSAAHIDYDGYVPENIGIGGGDYVEFAYCTTCGQIQGEFPVDLKEAGL